MKLFSGLIPECREATNDVLEGIKASRRPNNTYGAASSVAAGVSGAFVDLGLAAGPSESRPAGTGVAALAGVATSGPIHAGLVVSAVVEIWRDTAAHVD